MNGGIVPLSLTTMDALTVMMWESGVSQVYKILVVSISSNEAVYHYIYMYTASCLDGQIKLIGGYSERNGHLEICSNQRWETLSLSDWGDIEAVVACNTLGYGYGMFI